MKSSMLADKDIFSIVREPTVLKCLFSSLAISSEDVLLLIDLMLDEVFFEL